MMLNSASEQEFWELHRNSYKLDFKTINCNTFNAQAAKNYNLASFKFHIVQLNEYWYLNLHYSHLPSSSTISTVPEGMNSKTEMVLIMALRKCALSRFESQVFIRKTLVD